MNMIMSHCVMPALTNYDPGPMPDKSAAMMDVIVADYHLGDGYTGLEVIRALNEKRGEQSKALIITGHVNPEELSRLRNGQYPVLSKPVAPVMLRSALHNLMAN